MELPYLFEPKPDESPLGYYRRLSGANALRNWKELAMMAEVSPSRTGLLGRPEHVASMLNIPLEWTRRTTEREKALLALRSLHRSRRDAVCPQCIADDPFLRIGWEHVYVTACPTHKTALVDHCSACGEGLVFQRERIEYCQCGEEIGQQVSAPATDVQVWLSGLLFATGAGGGGMPPKVAGAAPSDVTVLARTLCQWFDVDAAAPRRNAAAPKTVSEAVEFLKPLEQLLQHWPTSYKSHVRIRLVSGPARATTLRSRLGHWYEQLRSVASKGPLKVFLTPVLSVAAKEFEGAIAMDDVAGWEDLKYVRLGDAVRENPINISSLRRAVANNLIVHRVSRYGAHGKVYQVLRADVDRMVKSRAGWVSEATACKRLQVPPRVLSNMAVAGLIEADFDWLKDPFKGGPVRTGAVEALEAKLFSQRSITPSSGDLISFKEITSRRLGDNSAIQALMRAIHSGEVLAQKTADNVGHLQYLLSDVRRFFGTPLLEAGLSVHQLGKLTGWKHESINHWIAEGLLQSHSIVLRGQPCKVVMPAQLLEFTRTYVPLADLSRMLGSTSRLLAKKLQHVDIIAGKSLAGGVQRGGLVRMADIARSMLTTRDDARQRRATPGTSVAHEPLPKSDS